ncbi:hypothetical protein [Photorhabdus namnaonensis]|uniref:Uncharacterized protein n=1 Tax=Photorhabdus namnaonensis TaxID=1851568 RepID=A0A1B8YFR3_9GAMM|nr:hypothetical protein [Photorhabdus namnaonensis]OCA53907.1 hypothetical protein Phpb_03011 [Photorhabdus namnaonensis]
MVAHVHAELMMQYAQDAFKTDKPWLLWEMFIDDGTWEGICSHPSWYPDFKYRRKPEMITVGKVNFPKPVDCKLEVGDKYYIIFNSYMMAWGDCDEDYDNLESGRIHLTFKAAKQHENALIKISKGEF